MGRLVYNYATTLLRECGFTPLQHDGDALVYILPQALAIADTFRVSAALAHLRAFVLDEV